MLPSASNPYFCEMSTLRIEVTRIVTELPDVKTIYFQPDRPLTYRAGQFITLIRLTNGHELRRNYSFSSAPSEAGIFSITFKRIPNGAFSRWLFDQVKVGDQIDALEPAGLFTVSAEMNRKGNLLVFLAAGSGITPIFSIIKELLARNPAVKLLLIYSNKTASQALFAKELKALQHQYPSTFDNEWLFSDHADLMKARLSKLVLQEIVRQRRLTGWDNTWVFACGPFEYMRTARIVLMNEGLPDSHYRREQFQELEPVKVDKQYYDQQDRVIRLDYRGQQTDLLVPWNVSILDAALKAGISLPYSCHAGRCSTCRGKLLRGKVWMHYNQVLTDADEAAGWILVCTGHPVTADVHIKVGEND